MKKLINISIIVFLSLGIFTCTGCSRDKDEPEVPQNNNSGNENNSNEENSNEEITIESVKDRLIGVWISEEGQDKLEEFLFNSIGSDYKILVLCDDFLGYTTNEDLFDDESKRTVDRLIHWEIEDNINETSECEFNLSFRASILPEKYYAHIESNETLIIEKGDGRQMRFYKHPIYSNMDFKVQSKILSGCWFYSPGTDRGRPILDGTGYVLCKDGTGYSFTDSDPTIKKDYLNWSIVWERRNAYFQNFTIENRPVTTGFYLDINLSNGIKYSYLVNDLWCGIMFAFRSDVELVKNPGTDWISGLYRDYSYISPSTASGEVIVVDGDDQGENNDDNSKLSDSEISSKLVGKWIHDKSHTSSYSRYYVFLDDGTGYWESLDTYSEACERTWFKWTVLDGKLNMNLVGIGDSVTDVNFEGSKLKLTINGSESEYSYSSVYLKYTYGEPPYNGYYICYNNKYYPIYTAEEKKVYANGGETYNHLYLLFYGKDNGKNNWISIDYATPRWDGLPAGWQEGKYYISTADGAYKYHAAFKVDGDRAYSTSSDYIVIKKEGNYYSYKYYGRNVSFNFSGQVR